MMPWLSETVVYEGDSCTRTIFYSEADRLEFLTRNDNIAAPPSMLLTSTALPPSPVRIQQNNYSLLILAGGMSRRMGTDKAFLPYFGTTLADLQRSKASLLGIEDLILAGNGRSVHGYHCVADPVTDAGPLGGLAAGLNASVHEVCAVVPVDTPGIYPSLIDTLAVRLTTSKANAIITNCAGRSQPLIAAYKSSLASKLIDHLKSGNRSVRSFLNTISFEEIVLPDDCSDSFLNLNTPEEYSSAITTSLEIHSHE